MRYFFKLLILFLFFDSIPAQVVFSKIPKQLQLFPRDSTNYGRFEVEGKAIVSGTLRTVVSEMLRGNVLETFSKLVNANTLFSINHQIPACLKEYKLELFFRDASLTEQSVGLIPNLVAGDFYIVDGQSNAECPVWGDGAGHDSAFKNPFNRVIGSDFSFATHLLSDSIHMFYSIKEDCSFARPSSSVYLKDGFGYSGLWPMSLQCELAWQTGIPNCVINGSQGGTSIYQHFASHTPSLPNSLRDSTGPKNTPQALLYDRIYEKLYANNAIAGVKGIFWYQGETDGTYTRDSSAHYSKRFRTLYNSWKADYPSLRKIFVLQINMGCGGEFHSLIRDIQRRLPEEYSDVTVMSTVGSPFSDRSGDGCHYTVDGYTRIATKLLPLVKKYIYNFPLEEEFILPANIQKAYYTSANQLCLEFNKNIIIQDSCVYPQPYQGTAYLKDYFFTEENVQIRLDSITSEKNKIFLNLNPKQVPANKITYLPQIFTNIPSLYTGPWILTENNEQLGAYSFFEFPVQPLEHIVQQMEDVLVYPNPATKILEVKFRENAPHEILIYDLFGRIILTSSASQHAILDVSTFSSGIYLLVIKSLDGNTSSKIVIE